MAFYSIVDLAGSTSQSNFTFSFPYLDQDHIHVYVDEVETTAFTFLSASSIALDTPLVSAATVRVRRITPVDEAIVDYSNGSVLGETDLDSETLQSLYGIQEVADAATLLLEEVMLKNAAGTAFDAQSLKIENLAEPTELTDAVTKSYADENLAVTLSAAAAALVSETNAAASEDQSQFSSDNANTAAASANASANLAVSTVASTFAQANAAFDRANAAYANANTAIYTAAQIRANISNTTPIRYDASTGIISHALSGASSGVYGNAAIIPSITVDTNGHITLVSNVALIQGTTSVPGIVLLEDSTSSTSTTNAATPHIVNTVNTIATSAYAQANTAFDRANAAYSNANTAIYTAAQIRANISNSFPVGYSSATGVISLPSTANGQLHIGNTVSGTFSLAVIAQTAPVIVVNDKGSITLSHASSGVTATTYGNASFVPVATVDAFGHVTAVTNTAIALSAAAITSGTLLVARGGTGQASYANGQILAGNGVSTGLDLTTIAQTAPVIVVNGKGTITLSHASSGVTATTYGNASYVGTKTVDAFGHVTAASNVLIQIQSNNVLSTVTSDSAAANTLGEFISAASPTGGNGTIAATGTYNNLTSVTLGAGDWDVEGSIELKAGSTTVATKLTGGISKTTNAMDVTSAGGYFQWAGNTTVSSVQHFPTSRRRISLSAATLIQLTGALTYSALGGATWGANSFISARRTR